MSLENNTDTMKTLLCTKQEKEHAGAIEESFFNCAFIYFGE